MEAAKVVNVLEVVTDAGDEMDVQKVKLNMNDDFLVAFVLVKFDNEKRKNFCFYFVWDRHDYSKSPFRTEWFQPLEALSGVISDNILDIPVISDDGNLLIDENKRYTDKPEVACEELNLRTKLRRRKLVKLQDFVTPAINYRHKNEMVSKQETPPQKLGGVYTFLPYTTLIFRSKDQFLWQKKFEWKNFKYESVIGFSKNQVAISKIEGFSMEERMRTVTVYRLMDGEPVLKLSFDYSFFAINSIIQNISPLIVLNDSETEVQFSRNRIACNGRENVDLFDVNSPRDLYILDIATEKVILECNQDLKLSEVKKFLFLEDSLVLEQDNKIVLAKFWV